MDSLFSYKATDSFLHRTPALIKLLFLFAVPVTVMLTSIKVCLVLIAAIALIAILGKIRVRDFLRDQKPVVFYSLMIVVLDALAFLLFDKNQSIVTTRSLHMILRLLCAMEATSVFFRTTSSFEIREAISFGHPNNPVSDTFALFLSFLPQVFETWTQLELAYRSRGGKNGPMKVLRLFPLLITMSMKKAGTTYLALLNRS
ncbi:MAG: energy-coupling factor transporter transmembrane component T family protein [Spirochaetales bacterium]